jgi:hypothetical protein
MTITWVHFETCDDKINEVPSTQSVTMMPHRFRNTASIHCRIVANISPQTAAVGQQAEAAGATRVKQVTDGAAAGTEHS